MIPNFSSIAKPITELLKKDSEFVWSDDCQVALQTLIDLLLERPILQFPDFTKPFIISTDACGYGMGAVLAQRNEAGKELPIAFASKLQYLPLVSETTRLVKKKGTQ
jgi:hypothetical protein